MLLRLTDSVHQFSEGALIFGTYKRTMFFSLKKPFPNLVSGKLQSEREHGL